MGARSDRSRRTELELLERRRAPIDVAAQTQRAATRASLVDLQARKRFVGIAASAWLKKARALGRPPHAAGAFRCPGCWRARSPSDAPTHTPFVRNGSSISAARRPHTSAGAVARFPRAVLAAAFKWAR